MGYLTTITLYNDAMHEFKKHPKKFAEALFDGIIEANREHKEVSVGFKNYGGYISVQPSYHADEHQLYIHCGNGVFNLNPWSADFEDLLNRNVETAEDFVKHAELLLKEAKKRIKDKRAR